MLLQDQAPTIIERLGEIILQDAATTTFDFKAFLLNAFACLLMTFGLSLYFRWRAQGRGTYNVRKFSLYLVPLALGTLVLISVVGSSIALALGLVGSLSIIRFRTNVPDVEMLVYLFMAIGIGLACGTGQPAAGAIAMTLIIGILEVRTRVFGGRKEKVEIKVVAGKDKGQEVLDLMKSKLDSFELFELIYRDESETILVQTINPSLDDIDNLSEEIRKIDTAASILIELGPQFNR